MMILEEYNRPDVPAIIGTMQDAMQQQQQQQAAQQQQLEVQMKLAAIEHGSGIDDAEMESEKAKQEMEMDKQKHQQEMEQAQQKHQQQMGQNQLQQMMGNQQQG
jgi:hypothetical protein